VVAELDDADGLVAVMQDREVVFMCAGHYPRYSLNRRAEVAMARRRAKNVFDATRRAGAARCVLTSSITTVGPPAPPRTLTTEADPPLPRALRSVYYATKWAIEAEAQQAAQQGLDLVTICPTGIVGELDVRVGTGFLLVGLATRRMRWYVDGRINVVGADRVGQAHLLAAERGQSGHKYIVAGHNLTLYDLCREAADELGVPFDARRLPLRMAGWLSSLDEWRCARRVPQGRPFISREFVDMARFGCWVDGSAAVHALGLPEPPPLRATLRKAIDWYTRYRYIPAQTSTSSPGDPT
jgi:dihydroflavonol-4-reductase